MFQTTGQVALNERRLNLKLFTIMLIQPDQSGVLCACTRNMKSFAHPVPNPTHSTYSHQELLPIHVGLWINQWDTTRSEHRIKNLQTCWLKWVLYQPLSPGHRRYETVQFRSRWAACNGDYWSLCPWRLLEVTNEPPASREKLFPTYLPAIILYHLEIIVKYLSVLPPASAILPSKQVQQL